jgi:hypothetical protein
MKQKLKLLFAFLRSFKTELIKQEITLSYESIEDWDINFVIDYKKKKKTLDLPITLKNIIQELIVDNMDDFLSYVNLKYDDYWNLYVYIYPFENKIVFKSSCKERTENSYEYDLDITEIPPQGAKAIKSIYENNPDLTKFEFKFYGDWDDGNVYGVEFDGRDVKIDTETNNLLWEIVNTILVKKIEIHWNDGPGGKGNVDVWGDDVYVYVTMYEEEYALTNMNITINLNTYK